ncbi:MAG: PRC-barrel domain-containing protein [Rubrobacteraceae bacterium]
MTQAPEKHRGSGILTGGREEYVGYTVFDPLGQKIGSVEKLFFNENGELEYVRARIGRLFTKHILIPVQDAALDREAPDP